MVLICTSLTNIRNHKSDYYNDGVYKDYKINIDKDQVLSLDLYDSCKYCKNKSIDNREILIEDRVSGKITLKKFASSDNVYYIDQID